MIVKDCLSIATKTITNYKNRQPVFLCCVEVYLRTIAPVVADGGQVLVLVPEIALTPQTLGRFQRRFPRVGMMHSNLTDHERLQTWLKCATGELSILIGTRSAIFTPFAQLGLIVVDEEHDSSYKQQEGLRYSARDLATKRAQTDGIPIVLGSATPSLESLYNVKRKRYQQLLLPYRAGGAQMPKYQVIDMRGMQHNDGISQPLERVIRSHLEADGQVHIDHPAVQDKCQGEDKGGGDRQHGVAGGMLIADHNVLQALGAGGRNIVFANGL